ncbi:V-type ATP synthase subunit D [Candidatus Woesearchaeota archaeon]|nr:MAG: V-type ATP synthase subunit D [Candidatus Woesearchaeota archaeon]
MAVATNIKATRMELLRLKRKKKLAIKGHKLLKEKRDALVSEFFKLIEDLEQYRSKAEEKLSTAFRALVMAQAISGKQDVVIAANSNSSWISLKSETRTIMGVKVPKLDFEAGKDGRGYSKISSSAELDTASEAFEEALKEIIKLAELESTAEKLAEEIKKTKRKVNALEQIVIPRISESITLISMRLEEMERENFARLKVIKGNMEAAEEAAN